MKRRLSTRARLERLEETLKNGATSHRQAIVEMCDWNDFGTREKLVLPQFPCKVLSLQMTLKHEI